MLKSIFIILIIIICFIIIMSNIKTNIIINNDDNNDNYIDIDNIVIIERPQPNINLINKLLNEKPYLYPKNKMDIIKRKFQVYSNKNNKLTNISEKFYNKKNTKNNKTVNDPTVLINLFSEPIYKNNISKLKSNSKITNKPFCNKKLYNYYYDINGNSAPTIINKKELTF